MPYADMLMLMLPMPLSPTTPIFATRDAAYDDDSRKDDDDDAINARRAHDAMRACAMSRAKICHDDARARDARNAAQDAA